MKIKDIHKTAGQQVQYMAVENQKLQGNKENLDADLIADFDWRKTNQGWFFWNAVYNEITEEQLKEIYPEIFKQQTPKEIAQNILKGLSDEVIQELKKQLETNKTK